MNTVKDNVFKQRPDIGYQFSLLNDHWIVTATTNRFVIATRHSVCDEPQNPNDILKLIIH